MNEELLEDALAAHLAAFLTAESIPAHVVGEDGEITENSLPVMRAGIFAEVDQQHVIVTAATTEAEPVFSGNEVVMVSVSLRSPQEIGRAAHAARARVLRKALVRDNTETLLNALAAGVAIDLWEFTGKARAQGQDYLGTALNFKAHTRLTE